MKVEEKFNIEGIANQVFKEMRGRWKQVRFVR